MTRVLSSLELILSNGLPSDTAGFGTVFCMVLGFCCGFSTGLLAALGGARFDAFGVAFESLHIKKNSKLSNNVFLFQLVGVCPNFCNSFRNSAEDIFWYFDMSPAAGKLTAGLVGCFGRGFEGAAGVVFVTGFPVDLDVSASTIC